MNNQNVGSYNMVTGSVIQKQVICNETPFFLNKNGDIAFRREDFVVIKVLRGSSSEIGQQIDFLNMAFKLGYETNRFTYE